MSVWEEADDGWEDVPEVNVPGIIDPLPNVPQKIYGWKNPNPPGMRPKPPMTYAEKQRQANAEKMGFFRSAETAFGNELFDLGTGIKQALNFGDPQGAKDLRNEYEAGQRYMKPIKEEHSVGTFVGQNAPYVYPSSKLFNLASKGMLRLAKRNPTKLLHQPNPVALGAATGLGEGLAVGALHPGLTTAEGGAYGLIGGTAGGYVGRLLGKRPTDLTDADVETLRFGDELGIKWLPGDRTRIPYYQRMDSTMGANPRTDDPYNAIKKENTAKINHNVYKTTGSDVSNMTVDELQNLDLDLSDAYADMISMSKGKLDMDTINTFVGVVDDVERRIPGKRAKFLRGYGDRLVDISEKNLDINGPEYQKLYSDITHMYRTKIRSTKPSDAEDAFALNKMRRALVDNVEKRLPDDLKGKWKKLRSQYAATRLLLDNNVIDIHGNVKPRVLANILKRPENRKNYQQVKGPWSDMIKAARVGEYLMDKPGPGLRLPHALSKAVGTGVKPSLAGMLLGHGSELPMFGKILSKLYRSGFPHVTGYVPGLSPKLTSIGGSTTAITEGR